MINLELPDLPYSKDSLTPYMSAETLELHHDKHHMAYVTNGNKFIKENNLNEESIELNIDVICGSNNEKLYLQNIIVLDKNRIFNTYKIDSNEWLKKSQEL